MNFPTYTPTDVMNFLCKKVFCIWTITNSSKPHSPQKRDVIFEQLLKDSSKFWAQKLSTDPELKVLVDQK